MRRIITLVGAAAALALLAAAPAAAHNAGCVQTGNGEWVFVGSRKDAPLVPESNPNRNTDGQLDLQPGSGDQYGARYAADQGNSAVERPASCTAPPPRG
ncbi:MAG TPA: hypothetical protein VNJ53_07965 [Gaiellaceae bacterium]|nr:hypothetical protein [Gaiellaceae bacterium]